MITYGSGRDLLIRSAIAVVVDQGLRGLTFRAVAARANVSNALIAHHFGTRTALLAAALDWSVESSIEISGLLDLTDEVKFVDSLIAMTETEQAMQVFQYEMILEARRNEVFRASVVRLYERYHEAVIEALRSEAFGGAAADGPEMAALARHIFAALDGLVMQSIAGVDVDELRSAAHSVWASLRLLPAD